jgi:hypothetical protein
LQRCLDLAAELIAKARAGDAFVEAQTHHQHFIAALARIEDDVLLDSRTARLDRAQPGLGCAPIPQRVLAAFDAQPTMRARPEAEIVAIAPIDEIVAARAAVSRVI